MPTLESAVERWIRESQAAWPDVALNTDVFLGHVEKVLRRAPARLDAIHGTHLYLAAACAAGNAAAIRHLDRDFLVDLRPIFARVRPAGMDADDAGQNMRELLLVSPAPGEPPRIAQYNGAAHLKGWLRVAMTRAFLRAARSKRHEKSVDQKTLEALTPASEGFEAAHLKETYVRQFKAAFQRALGRLTPRDRNLLRYSFGRRLSIDAIGAIYGVHRATAARWIERLLQKVQLESLGELKAKLGGRRSEMRSLLGLIRSHADLTLERYLGHELELSGGEGRPR